LPLSDLDFDQVMAYSSWWGVCVLGTLKQKGVPVSGLGEKAHSFSHKAQFPFQKQSHLPCGAIKYVSGQEQRSRLASADPQFLSLIEKGEAPCFVRNIWNWQRPLHRPQTLYSTSMGED
jgi:hypothetical protein